MASENGRPSTPPCRRGARCKARTQRGTPCQLPANRGYSVCRVHGAGTKKRPGGRPPTHGLYSKRLKATVQELLEKLREDPRVKTIDGAIEWAAVLQQRAVDLLDAAEEELVALGESGRLTAREARRQEGRMVELQGHLGAVTDRLAGFIERRHRMLHGERLAITLGTLDQLLREVDRLIEQFVDVSQREAARLALVERLRAIPMPDTAGMV